MRMKAKQQQVDRDGDGDRGGGGDGEDGGMRHTVQTSQHANASVRLLQGCELPIAASAGREEA